MRAVGREALEGLVEKLDAKVRAGAIAWKTAIHSWGLVTRMFADASGAKRRDLRVREDNPAAGVHGPDRGARRAKVYLYPEEFLQLVACPDVPLRWRRMFALTTYLYARAGEVNALTWADVDLERGVVHIHRSASRRTGESKSTKTGGTRRVPVEPHLLPLLCAMHTEAGGVGRVSPVDATDKKTARQLQRCLRLAGLTRADLYADDATRKPLTFHDLRSTGLTWCAVRAMTRCASSNAPDMPRSPRQRSTSARPRTSARPTLAHPSPHYPRPSCPVNTPPRKPRPEYRNAFRKRAIFRTET